MPFAPDVPSTRFHRVEEKFPAVPTRLRAAHSWLEFSDKKFGALISTLPPLPPCEPPLTSIRLPTLSLKLFPDCRVTLPPELPPAESSPLARIWELAPRFELVGGDEFNGAVRHPAPSWPG